MHSFFEQSIFFIHRYFRSLDRTSIIWYIGVGYVIFLMITTFRYTILEYDFYSAKAKDQQTMILKNPSSRGTVYSSDESFHGAMAVSTNLGNLSIDPTQTGSRDKLLTFLSDVVFDEFCKNSSECLKNMGGYLRENLTDTKDMTVTQMKEKIRLHL